MTQHKSTRTRKKKSFVARMLAGATALAVMAFGAFFTGIGEGAINRLMDPLSLGGPSTSAPTGSPSAGPREALSVVARTDIGAPRDLFALRAKESEGPVAAALVAGTPGEPWDAFLRDHDGAPVGSLVVSLVLTGHRDPGVLITGIGVEKVHTEPVLAGTSIQLTSAGEVESIKVTANLDEASPTVKAEDGTPYFPDRNISLKDGEQAGVKISMTASAKYYRWAFAIDYVDETGAAHRTLVDRTGHSFQDVAAVPSEALFALTGAAPRYGAAWEQTQGDRSVFKPVNGQ